MDGLVNVYEMNLSQKDGFADVSFKNAFRRFAIGFNRGAHYTFNFIDVGGGRGLKLKEITDAKLRDTFRMSKYPILSPVSHYSWSSARGEVLMSKESNIVGG